MFSSGDSLAQQQHSPPQVCTDTTNIRSYQKDLRFLQNYTAHLRSLFSLYQGVPPWVYDMVKYSFIKTNLNTKVFLLDE